MAILFPKREYSPAERMFRVLAMILVLLAVIWAFWKNTDRTLDMIETRAAIYDQTGEMTDETKEFTRSFASSLREEFGLDFRLQVMNDALDPPELDQKTVYIGLRPSWQESLVVFPPLVERALGQDFRLAIQEGVLQEGMQTGRWQGALVETLIMIYEGLTGIGSPEGGPDGG